MDAQDKLTRLKQTIEAYGSLAVAFSGGVDSTFLLKVAHDVLGKKCMALTLRSCLLPAREMDEAMSFCAAEGIDIAILDVDPLSIEGFSKSPANRCYLCKRANFEQLLALAKRRGFSHLAEGSNTDDMGDYRPGMQAIKELSVLSPLRDAGLAKEEIRTLSKEMGLPTWDKPSYACLATRFPYGEIVTEEKLKMVEQAEAFLLAQGFRQLRVRVHGDIARLEVPVGDFQKLMADEMRKQVVAAMQALGFHYVAMDLLGYRTGSMNEVLPKEEA